MTDFAITSDGPRMFFLSGELDLATVPLKDMAIGDAVSRGGPITIDMSGVTFVDSSGIVAILKAAKDLPSGCIVLRGAQDATRRLFDIMEIGKAPNVDVIPCSVLVPVG